MFKTALLTLVIGFGIQAQAFFNLDINSNVKYFQNHAQAQAIGTLGLPWVVGEKSNYNIKMAIFTGTMVMEVKQETENGFWVHQDMEIIGQKNLVEMLFDKDTGEVLEVIANGEKQDIPEQSDAEIIEQKEEPVTVPAGTYDSIYVKMRSEGQDSEMWVNPIDIPVFGLLKQISPSQLGPVTLELTEFTDL